MKSIVYCFCAFMLLFIGTNSTSTFGQIKSFEETLEIANMQFKLPQGCLLVAPVKNSSMLYSYAFQDSSKSFEIRYRIDPITAENPQFHTPQSRGTTALTVLFNISDKSVPIPELAKRLSKAHPDMVKKEFNADDAIISAVQINDDFTKDYNDSFMLYIHKEGVANVWLFVLINDKEEFRKVLQRGILGALKFNE